MDEKVRFSPLGPQQMQVGPQGAP